YDCHVTYDQYVWLDLKAGVKRTYVVKDLLQFLEDVFFGNEYFFTKKFTYSPEHHYVLKQDIEVMEMLYDILRNEQVYETNRHSAHNSQLDDKRYMLIPPIVARDELPHLAERTFMAGTGRNRQPASIEIDVVPIQYSLSKNDNDELLLTHNELSHPYDLSPYPMPYHEGTFSLTKTVHSRIVEQVMALGWTGNTSTIGTKQADVI